MFKLQYYCGNNIDKSIIETENSVLKYKINKGKQMIKELHKVRISERDENRIVIILNKIAEWNKALEGNL